ncbi:T9SS sorting signal type C domain-containing protein [Flavobacterium sp. FZUC8N2.13]|uniref:T9SS sorting signal type C domain-containing protein n=1 Tax=Flavobacterium zubiriense TaxID=3138075 RepID=A0ABV4TD47_9FLAO
MKQILLKKSFFIFIILLISTVGYSQCSITASRNTSGLSCGNSPLSTCGGVLYIGDGTNAMTLIMTSNLNLSCLGPIRLIIRNNATVDFSSGNFDLQLAAGSSIEIENGGQLGAATNCSASDLIKIGNVNVASCNGGGSGVLTSFPGLVASGGYSSINATASPSSICNSGNTTLTATASPSSGATYRWYNTQSGGTLLHTGSTYTPFLNTTTTYYVDASYTSPTYTTIRRAVTVTVNPNSVGGTASASQSICSGSTPSNISLSGYTGTIQWQVSTNNSTFTNISGANSATLTSAQMGTLTATRYYRAVVTSGNCSSSNSNTVTVTVNATPSVPSTASPYSATCSGFTAQWGYASNATNYILDIATDSGFTSIVSGYNNLSVGDVLSYVVTGLNPATTYYYRVRASGCSTSANSGTMSIATSTVAIPSIASPYSATCSGFTAQWGYSANATNYIIDVATDFSFTSIVSGYNNLSVGNVLNYAITGLNPATTYYYRVRASGCSTSANSSTMSNTTSTIAIPSTASPYSATCTGFTAQWGFSANATNYIIDVATDSGFTSIVSGYNNLSVGNVLNYAITGLNPATTYYYRVRASGCSTSANSGTMNYTTSPVPASIPVVIGASNSNCSNGLQLNWNQVTNATGYYLDISTNNSFSSFVSGYNGFNIGYQTSSFYAGGLSSGLTYYYRIRAYNSCSTTASSNVVSFSIGSVGGTVTGSTAVCSGINSTVLTLSGHTGNIVRWESSLNNFATAGITIANTTTTLTATNLTATTSYRAVVQNGSCSMLNSTIATIAVTSLSTPIASTPTNPSCKVPTGSVQLSGLPSSGTIVQTGERSENIVISGGGSQLITGLHPGTYYFAVSYGGCTSATVTVEIIAPDTNTWSGSWSNGTPTISQRLVFATHYTNANDVDVEGCSCLVTGSAEVTIKSGHTLKIENGVEVQPNAKLTFENNASLVQINDDAVNSGDIHYHRHTAPVKRFDFTYWSSPVTSLVAPQTLKKLSPNTLFDKYFSYNNGWVLEKNGVATMTKGRGYIIRAPQNFSTTVAAIDTIPVFVGEPHNGVCSFPITGNQVHLLGNPYPSALNADLFLDENELILEGTLYFWTHNTAPSTTIVGANLYNYTSNDYATYNRTGGVGTRMSSAEAAYLGGAVPTGRIAAGQGFFAPAKATGNIVFNNRMRLGTGGVLLDNSQFFKLKTSAKESANTTVREKSRIWLNLTNKQGAFKQTLVGYVSGATNDYDGGFDGVSYDGNQFVDFYSVNNATNLAIQGRALPFVKQDSIVLGYKSAIIGEFQISIDRTDGTLATQNVFLEDKVLAVLHDLKKEPYTFSTEKGIFNNRFVLRYVDKNAVVEEVIEPTLPVEEQRSKEVVASVKNSKITINSAESNLEAVVVYDSAGRLMYQKNNVANSVLVISNIISSQQVLLITIELENGTKVSRKVVYN